MDSISPAQLTEIERRVTTAMVAAFDLDLSGLVLDMSNFATYIDSANERSPIAQRGHAVVDEASMVGSRSLDKLRHHVDVAGAKLVLVGDNRQLSSIDAGGALRTLSKELGGHVVTLSTNRRQAEPDQQWERDALVALRDGNVAPAVHAYADHGRVTLAGTIDEARQRLIDGWWAVHHQHTTAILAVRRVDVRTLNELARARRQAAGELGQEFRVGEKTFSVGDRVIFERNQRVRGADRVDSGEGTGLVRLRNGTFATVVGVVDPAAGDPAHNARTREGDVTLGQGDVARADELEAMHEWDAHQEAVSTLVVELDDGSRAVLPRDYAEHSTSLGYALTVFRSQGITVDYAFGLGGDALFQEAGYTQLSRGRLSNNFYVAAPDCPQWEVGHLSEDATQRGQLDALVEALSSSREQIMAQDHLPSWAAVPPCDLEANYRQHADLGRWLAEHAPADRTDELAESWNRDHEARTTGREVNDSRDELATLAQAQRQRNDWIARHRDEITTWSQLDGAISRYEYRLGQVAAFGRPEHVTDLLGPFPERIAEAERWQVAAGAVEAYRSRWNIAGEVTIDTESTNPEQRAHWDKMAATLASAGFSRPGGAFGQEADQPWLASLWVRVRDLDRVRDEANLERVTAGAPQPFSWSSGRDSGYDRGRDDGFGL